MGFLRDIRSVVTLVLLSAAAVALIFWARPALSELKQAKAELRHWEFEIDRLRNFAAPRADEGRTGDPGQIPETPDVASMMSTARSTQEKTKVSALSFETMQTEDRFLPELSDESGNPYEYLYSEIRITFNSSMRQAAEFIDSMMVAGPGGNVQRLALTRRQDERDPVHVSVTVGLNGIPR
jgi:hypothetical protein